MTQVYLHPHIEDYFVEYDFEEVRCSPADGGPNDLRRRLIEDYVSETVILLRNVRIDYDRDFIGKVNFPATWAYKKFHSKAVERDKPLDGNPPKEEICRDLFQGDRALFRKFESELRTVNGAIRGVLGEILRHHRVTAEDIIWRHTETRVENLHFDIDKDAAAFESVRLYFNMDDVPRIWHVSHPLREILAAFYEPLELAGLADAPLEELLRRLSLRLFGNWSSRGREQFPRHLILFEPGDVWICDGRTVPHQVIYGRRVLSTFYKLDSSALPDWHQSLTDKVRATHQTFREGRWPERGGYDMRGFAPPFEDGGPKVPEARRDLLKRDWSELYRESLQDKLVRL